MNRKMLLTFGRLGEGEVFAVARFAVEYAAHDVAVEGARQGVGAEWKYRDVVPDDFLDAIVDRLALGEVRLDALFVEQLVDFRVDVLAVVDAHDVEDVVRVIEALDADVGIGT